MQVAIRVDSSLCIGSGHVMRCLTLADALAQRDAECHFICREHPGHLIELIRSKGYSVHVLPYDSESPGETDGPAHAAWLGATQEQDVQACRPILQMLQPDWLIVDHYALDIRWEEVLQPFHRRLMIIDDLADRSHCCDLLLDQNLGRQVTDYTGLVPRECTVLAGPRYALLRPEFAALREYSVERRKQHGLRNLLIAMGGVDLPNATGKVLAVLKQCSLPDDLRISVVMGGKAPWLEDVRGVAIDMPRPTKVLVNVTDMAQLMADCDLAVGAAGGTSWERCCLGVPTIMVVLADNQWSGAQALQDAQAACLLGDIPAISWLPTVFARFEQHAELKSMSIMSTRITDGLGTTRVVDSLIGLPG